VAHKLISSIIWTSDEKRWQQQWHWLKTTHCLATQNWLGGAFHSSPTNLLWGAGVVQWWERSCKGFDSRARCHMWVEFVVGSRPCSEGFSPGSLVFLPPQKLTFLNFNSIGNSRATGLSVEDCYVLPSLKQSRFIYFIYINLLPINNLGERYQFDPYFLSSWDMRL